MQLSRRLAALVLAAALLISLAFTAAGDSYTAVYREYLEDSYAGKTVILQTNDVHGYLENYAVLPPLKKELERRGAEVLLLDIGDFSIGTPYVYYSKGRDAVTLMNAVGYDAACLGNHEFDLGPKQLLQNLSMAQFPVLCANVYYQGERLCQPAWTKTLSSGLTLGFFALDTPLTFSGISADRLEEITILSGQEMAACAQGQIDALRDQGADMVLGMFHLGVGATAAPADRSFDVYRKLTGCDFVLDGHSHVDMTEGPDGEPIQNTGSYFKNIGVVVLDNATASVEENFLLPTDGLPQDASIASMVRQINEKVDTAYAQMRAVSQVSLPHTNAAKGEIALGDLLTDGLRAGMLREYGAMQVGEDHVVALLRSGDLVASLPRGTVSRRDVQLAMTRNLTVSLVSVTGRQLQEILEAATSTAPAASGDIPQTSGITFTVNTGFAYDPGTPYATSHFARPASFRRVTINKINGRTFRPNDTYLLLTDNVTAAGVGPYGLLGELFVRNTGVLVEECVAAYVEEDLNKVIPASLYSAPRKDQTWISGGFTDVFPSDYYYDAVLWAVGREITNGVTATRFAPNVSCTRGQMATFLWRMAGCPEPKAAPAFTDVSPSEYYYDAVAWAAEQGIATGMGNGLFRPNIACTREQMVTFLYRAAGKPTVSQWASFSDVTDKSFAYEAISWAAQEGITTGVGEGKFSPGTRCSRGQMMTFLYRFANSDGVSID